MPELKTRNLFISHAWSYAADYEKIVEWLTNGANFSWKNFSVPIHDSLPDKTASGLKAGMSRQIAPAQGVIIIAGMYVSHSNWIDYEIDEAVRMGKVIIGVTPSGQERVPVKIQNTAKVIVRWNSQSVIDAVRTYV
jgi:MTH538 TIR-like domain (DUF1863)